uniref:Uncharacterized protein n=1 Tax=Fagus sylvatica TaxID=28930 RepID=A0A2N9IWH2_FAGSY
MRLVRSSDSITADDITESSTSCFGFGLRSYDERSRDETSRSCRSLDCVEIAALDGGRAKKGVGEIRRWRWRGEGGGTVLLRGGGFVGEKRECGLDGGGGRGRGRIGDGGDDSLCLWHMDFWNSLRDDDSLSMMLATTM